MKANSMNILPLKSGELRLEITLAAQPEAMVTKLVMLSTCGKPLEVEVKQQRKGRSLDANGMYWKFNHLLAEEMNIGYDELHLKTLFEYGVRGYVGCREVDVHKYARQFKHIERVGTCLLNDQEGVQLHVTVSSALYDTKEYSRLLSGLLKDCSEQGIEVINNKEFDRLIDQYKPKGVE